MKVRSIPEREFAFFVGFRPLQKHSALSLVDGFETKPKMTDERRERIKLLEKGNLRDKRLARLLTEHEGGKPAPLLSCPLFARKARMWWFANLHRIMQPFPQVFVVHLLFLDEAIPFGALQTTDWPKIAMRLRRQIERSAGRDVVAMGGFELKANYEESVWLPHAHVAVANCTRKQLETLRRHYPENRQMQVDPLRDPKQLLYTQKLNCLHRPLKRTGPVRPKSRRLRLRQHNEFMRWLAQYRPTELLFVLNVERGKTFTYRLNDRVQRQLIVNQNRGENSKDRPKYTSTRVSYGLGDVP